MHALAGRVNEAELVARTGRVSGVRGQLVLSSGPVAPVGELCRIGPVGPGSGIDAEVVGFDGESTLLMPLGSVEGIALGHRVQALGRMPDVPVGTELLGRVVDAFGRPVDGREKISAAERQTLRPKRIAALKRGPVDRPMPTGVRVIDALLGLARGQRIGLFAGSGVGKSTLMGMVARGTVANVNVIALIGERSREVREFVNDLLGVEGLKRSVVVVATAEEPALVRARAAYAATVIAEWFRDEGHEVLLMMDSLTRFAMARREIGLAVGEPPAARGYTASVFSELPQLCERAGPGAGAASITGIYTVLADGDDMNEPVADALRATLDGHIVLSRDIANAGQYPAVDVLHSISRLQNAISTPESREAARRLVACCSLYERNRQLIEIGAYKPGINHALDRALDAMPRIRRFLSQERHEKCSRDQALSSLVELARSLGDDDGNY